MLGSDDGFISVHRETRERKKKKPPTRLCFRGFTPALLCGRKSRVLLHANYLSRVADRQAAPGCIDAAYVVLPHGAGTGGAEAPRQRRAQRAEGKGLRGVAPVVACNTGSAGRAAIVANSNPSQRWTSKEPRANSRRNVQHVESTAHNAAARNARKPASDRSTQPITRTRGR